MSRSISGTYSLNIRVLFGCALLICGILDCSAGPLTSVIGGVDGSIRTVDDRTILVQNLTIETPADLTDEQFLRQGVAFHSTPLLDFEQIQQLIFAELPVVWLGSRPEAIECYRLGDAQTNLPPPPDWQRSSGQIPPWSQAVTTSDTTGLPYLNHALFCWAPPGIGPQATQSGIYLFRQNFQVDAQLPIAWATLRIATNARLLSAALNEQPLHLGQLPATIRLGEYDVTHFLQPGSNILALQTIEDGPPAHHSSLAFHLEIGRRLATRETPPLDPFAPLLAGRNGTRVQGRIQEINSDRLTLDTPYGELTKSLDAIESIVLPLGWSSSAARRGWFKQAAPLREQPEISASILPVRLFPHSDDNRICLTDQRTIDAKSILIKGQELRLQNDRDEPSTVNVSVVRGIYPARRTDQPLPRFDAQAAQLFCTVKMNSGERLSGLLRALNGRKLLLEPEQGEPLTLKTKWIASITFSLHGVFKQKSFEQKIGIMPLLSSQERSARLYDYFAQQTQAAILSIGAEPASITSDMLNGEQLTPANFPVLVNIDPLGEYLATFSIESDAEQKLLQYIEQGGCLLALSRGGAFRTAVKRGSDGQFARGLAQPGLLGRLGYTLARPGDPEKPDIQAFNHPANRAEQLYFQRGEHATGSLLVLPRRILLGPMLTAPFFPLIPPQNGQPLFTLTGSGSTVYGPALSVTPYGKGRVVIIDHLLWECPVEDAPLCTRLLPVLCSMALSMEHGPDTVAVSLN